MKVVKLSVAIALAFVARAGCVRHKPVTNDAVRAFASVGASRAEVERELRALDAEFIYKRRSELDAELRVPTLEWQSSDSVGMYLGRVRDVRTVYYMLSSEHIEFEIEIGPTDLVSASRIYNTYTGP